MYINVTGEIVAQFVLSNFRNFSDISKYIKYFRQFFLNVYVMKNTIKTEYTDK
jgi:hypothetical protein